MSQAEPMKDEELRKWADQNLRYDTQAGELQKDAWRAVLSLLDRAKELQTAFRILAIERHVSSEGNLKETLLWAHAHINDGWAEGELAKAYLAELGTLEKLFPTPPAEPEPK